MNKALRNNWRGTSVAVAAALALSACGMLDRDERGEHRMRSNAQVVTLTGANEVPPVSTTAVGTANVTINPDRSVVVRVIVQGMTPTASHIHEGAAGANGPVVVPFTKTGDNTFSSGEGAKLTDSQYASYKAGNLYVNVHSAKNPGGEIRGQIKGN